MPRTKTKKIAPMKKSQGEILIDTPKPHSKKFFILGAAVIIMALALFLGRKFLVAAVVNGRPILRYQLDRELEKSYGSQVLNNLITENLIDQEANKAKIKITKDDINKEIESVKGTLPQGTDLNSALKSQNMTLDDFTKQVAIKLKAERILNPKITITDAEIEEFASKSAAMFSSTDSAKQKEEAKTILRQQKLGEAFGTWIDELKSKAKILNFSM